MQRLKLSCRRLMLSLLTSEERFWLYEVVNHRWITFCVDDANSEFRTMLELRKKGLVRFEHLVTGRFHWIGQRSPDDQVVKVKATIDGVRLSSKLLYDFALA